MTSKGITYNATGLDKENAIHHLQFVHGSTKSTGAMISRELCTTIVRVRIRVSSTVNDYTATLLLLKPQRILFTSSERPRHHSTHRLSSSLLQPVDHNGIIMLNNDPCPTGLIDWWRAAFQYPKGTAVTGFEKPHKDES